MAAGEKLRTTEDKRRHPKTKAQSDFPFGPKQPLAPRRRGMSSPHSLSFPFPSPTPRSTLETRITIYSKRKKHRLTRCFYSISTFSPLTENFQSRISLVVLSSALIRFSRAMQLNRRRVAPSRHLLLTHKSPAKGYLVGGSRLRDSGDISVQHRRHSSFFKKTFHKDR
jgi:hypothetical protein